MKKNFSQKNNQRKPRVNEQIRFSPVRLIDEKGQNIGEVSRDKALEKAKQVGLDLVEIAPQARPPVCRIIDFGKHQYEQNQKGKQSKQKQKTVEVKSVRISPRIGQHDLDTKAKQAEKFLNKGNRVRIEIKLRGREKAHQDFAKEKIFQFIEMIPTAVKPEQPPKREPSGLSVIIIKDEDQDK